jgi:uncharacterized membrane protein YhaH (DUF805 family)
MPHSMPHGDLASYRTARVAFRVVCVAMLLGAGWAVYAVVADTEADLYAIGEVAILGLILLVAFGPSLYQMARALRQIDIRAIRGVSLLPALLVFFLVDDRFVPTWGPDQPTFGGEVGFPAVSFLIAAVFPHRPEHDADEGDRHERRPPRRPSAWPPPGNGGSYSQCSCGSAFPAWSRRLSIRPAPWTPWARASSPSSAR